MHPILTDYLERLQSLHASIAETIEGLSTEALDWLPGSDMNSLGVLAVHVVGSQGYWIGELAGQEPHSRDRPAEFRVGGLDAESLVRGLDEVLARSRNVLEGLTLADLEASRASYLDGRKVSVAWCLAHALEHTGLHLGHMQITRQLWEQHVQK